MRRPEDARMSQDNTAIRVVNACKSFQKNRQALSAVDLTIEPGQCVGLLGASGSGKSTLLRSLCGLEKLDGVNSEVQLWGQTLQKSGKLSPAIRALRTHIGIIFQQFNLVGRMDVLTNVMTGLLPRMPLYRSLLGQFTTEERFQALQALHAVGLSEQAMQRASTLSGGQQQRAAIARALVQGARILLAHGATACTDLTGFGLVGHLLEMTRPSGVDVELDLAALPVLDGAAESAAAGHLSSLHAANAAMAVALRQSPAAAGHPKLPLLFDPQTAGGLLASVPSAQAQACLQALHQAGYGAAAVIGRVLPRSDAPAPVLLKV